VGGVSKAVWKVDETSNRHHDLLTTSLTAAERTRTQLQGENEQLRTSYQQLYARVQYELLEKQKVFDEAGPEVEFILYHSPSANRLQNA
jgi:hypothetical protein